MARFLELGSDVSSTPDVIVIPLGLKFYNILREREMRRKKLY